MNRSHCSLNRNDNLNPPTRGRAAAPSGAASGGASSGRARDLDCRRYSCKEKTRLGLVVALPRRVLRVELHCTVQNETFETETGTGNRIFLENAQTFLRPVSFFTGVPRILNWCRLAFIRGQFPTKSPLPLLAKCGKILPCATV